MSVPVIALFNPKEGVASTSLIYHLAWMFGDLHLRVVAADLDPQGDLTTTFLVDERLHWNWPESLRRTDTIFGYLQPLIEKKGDILNPHIIPAFYGRELSYIGHEFPVLDDEVGLLAGDPLLASLEDPFSEAWSACLNGDEYAFRVTSAPWRAMQEAAQKHRADVILLDLGSNFSALSRAALIAADYIVIPTIADIHSFWGLHNLGPKLRQWRAEWQQRVPLNPVPDLPLPQGKMQSVGYIVVLQPIRMDLPWKPYDYWMPRLTDEYRASILQEPVDTTIAVDDDPHCLAILKHYFGLPTMAREARKPIFFLQTADGLYGHADMQTVMKVFDEYQDLARKIAQRAQIVLPPWP